MPLELFSEGPSPLKSDADWTERHIKAHGSMQLHEYRHKYMQRPTKTISTYFMLQTVIGVAGLFISNNQFCISLLL